MERILLILIYSIISIQCNHSYKAEISCYQTIDSAWARFGNFLTCFASNHNTELLKIHNPDTKIMRVTGTDRGSLIADKIRNEIVALSMDNCHVNFIPQRVKVVLPRIKIFSCINCGLKALDKEDLKQFGDDLTVIWLLNNDLTSLDADAFTYNHNLLSIDLRGTRLDYIEPGFFYNLPNFSLKFLGLKNCGCIDQDYNYDQHGTYNPDHWQNLNCNDETKHIGSYTLRILNMMGKISQNEDSLLNLDTKLNKVLKMIEMQTEASKTTNNEKHLDKLEKKIDELQGNLLYLELKIDLIGNKPNKSNDKIENSK